MSGHIVLSSTPMWSHYRALCVFGSKIAAESAVTVTFLVPNWATTFEKATVEVARCLSTVEKPKGTVRIVAVGDRSVAPWDACTVHVEPFEPVWTALTDEEPVKCSVTGTVFPAAPKPTFVIFDGFQYPWLPTVRTLSPSLKVFVWMNGFSGGLLRACLPDARGGVGDQLRAPFTPDEWVNGKVSECTGQIIRIDGMPVSYDWESWPQLLHNTGRLQFIEANYARFVVECDGLVTCCAVGYDGQVALDVVSSWLAEDNHPTFHIGPVLPLEPGTTNFVPWALKAEREAAPPGVGDRVTSFLENALNEHGAHSVVYICFGNFFWPSNPDHLWLLIDTLANQGIPFILSTASPMAQVPDHIKARFEESDIGYLAPWAPQQYILSHQAVGWFLSHCGGNGSMEALSQGVPMLAWPFHADQPINAAHLVHTLDVAFELYEVRTGPYGLKPIYLTGKTPSGTVEAFQEELDGILKDMKGEVGARKRANAKRHQAILAEAWSAQGPAKKAFEALLQEYAH